MVASIEIIEQVVMTFRGAADANRQTPARRGNVIHIEPSADGEVMVTADLHGNRLNFDRLVEIADLDRHPARHLVMQEVCHGGPAYPEGAGCMSHLLLEDVARLKQQYPQRFHFLLSNHEWAEVADFPITKARKMLNLSFRCGLQQMYGAAADSVREAAIEFLMSCPLAVRVGDAIWICHALPERLEEEPFDAELFERPLNAADFVAHSDLFRLLWGRDFSPENAAAFAELVSARLLIHGHEPCGEGYAIPNPHQIILDCCGSKACYLILPTGQPLTQEEVVRRIGRVDGGYHA